MKAAGQWACLFVVLAPALGLPACLVPRSDEELWDVPFASDVTCYMDADCDDRNPCTVETCLRGDPDVVGLCRYERATDPPDDGDPCTIDVCVLAVEQHLPAEAGIPCGANGALSCDGSGKCVGCGSGSGECGANEECLFWACESNVCVRIVAGFGKLLAEQVPGDCAVGVCDGEGRPSQIPDENDGPALPDDPCRRQACSADSYPGAAPAGTPCGNLCSAQGDQVGVAQGACDGYGYCLSDGEPVACAPYYNCFKGACLTSCASDVDCYGAHCDNGTCVP